MRTDLGWQLDPAVRFFNHGSYGACPTDVLAVQRAFRDQLEHEPIAFLTRGLAARLDEARAAVGAFLGADPEGIAFVPNASTAVNTVLQSLRFGPGDELLTNDHEYNATINAMRAVAARDGARVVVAPVPYPIADPAEVVDAHLAAITPRTRLLVVSHVTSPTALVFPIESLIQAFDARGIDTFVDGAHTPGMVPLDIDAMAPAYWTGNPHKWLCAPKGSGILWVRADRRERIRPLVISHGANQPLADRSRYRVEFDWMGTADPTAYLTIPAAIEWMAAQVPGGWPEIMTANHALALEGRDRLAAALGVGAPSPDSMVGSMATVPIPLPPTDAAAIALHEQLVRSCFEVPVHGWPVPAARPTPDDPPRLVLLRLSAQRYLDAADFDELAEAVAAAIR
jgi:isopenicillin-N epimerase